MCVLTIVWRQSSGISETNSILFKFHCVSYLFIDIYYLRLLQAPAFKAHLNWMVGVYLINAHDFVSLFEWQIFVPNVNSAHFYILLLFNMRSIDSFWTHLVIFCFYLLVCSFTVLFMVLKVVSYFIN